jgi:CRISPR-associated endonuclease/helicase Cas3
MMKQYNSHPDKKLEVHIKGVHDKAMLNQTHNDSKISELVRYVTLLHDTGKLSQNFQDYILDKNKWMNNGSPYKNHSMIGTIYMLLLAKQNPNLSMDDMAIMFNVITMHHGDLRDRYNSEGISIFKTNEYKNSEAETAINHMCLIQDAAGFYHTHFKYDNISTRVGKDEVIEIKKILVRNFKSIMNVIRDKTFANLATISKSPIDDFLKQSWVFSSLLEADKRDASNNNYRHRDTIREEVIAQIADGLDTTFPPKSDKELSELSPLNKVRTEIASVVIKNLTDSFDSGKHIYTLTAPTGSGKTFLHLHIIRAFQKRYPDLDALYAINFITVSEQIANIYKDHEIDVLPVHSLSDNSPIRSDEVPDRKDYSNWVAKTFDHPLIITTFIQLFESLLTNRNKKIQKLVNYRKRVIILDEIQALPANMYSVLVPLLHELCVKHDSYLIISSATMPNFKLKDRICIEDNKTFELLESVLPNPSDYIDDGQLLTKNIFPNWDDNITELLDESYYTHEIFNRYVIHWRKDIDTDISLFDDVVNKDSSCLIICNTIAQAENIFGLIEASKDLEGYKRLLLDSRFTPEHRSQIVAQVKEDLSKNDPLILVSTNLIEAGVDVDFPVVYRDMCPLPNLIQSAGRCNRNGSLPNKGIVHLTYIKREVMPRFTYANDNPKSYYSDIYKDEGAIMADRLLFNNQSSITEVDIFPYQRKYYDELNKNLEPGYYSFKTEVEGAKEERGNLLVDLLSLSVVKVGKYSMINMQHEHKLTYFIPRNSDIDLWDEWVDIHNKLDEAKDNGDEKLMRQLDAKIVGLSKKMTIKSVSLSFKEKDKGSLPTYSLDYGIGGELGGFVLLKNISEYSDKLGLIWVKGDKDNFL